MEAIYTLLVLGLAVFSIVNLVSHMGNHGKLKKEHEEVMAGLASTRRMTNREMENFKTVYKTTMPAPAKVYKLRGAVSYIGVTINHAEQKEFAIGGARLHAKCSNMLKRKKVGVDLETYAATQERLQADEGLKAEVDALQEKMERENLSVEDIKPEMEALREKAMFHDAEFVFLKEEGVEKQAAFLVSLDDWKLSEFKPVEK